MDQIVAAEADQLQTGADTRAAFLARLHRETRVDKWVERIVRERVEIEESAFTAAKRALAS